MSDAKTLGDKVVDYVLNNEIRRLRDINKVLLEALHGALFFVPLGTNAYERANAAIAKAEGR